MLFHDASSLGYNFENAHDILRAAGGNRIPWIPPHMFLRTDLSKSCKMLRYRSKCHNQESTFETRHRLNQLRVSMLVVDVLVVVVVVVPWLRLWSVSFSWHEEVQAYLYFLKGRKGSMT